MEEQSRLLGERSSEEPDGRVAGGPPDNGLQVA
jgi:hypothetical protein